MWGRLYSTSNTYTFAKSREWHRPFDQRQLAETEQQKQTRERYAKKYVWSTFTFKDNGEIYAWTESDLAEVYKQVVCDILQFYGEICIHEMAAPFQLPHFTKDHEFFDEMVWRSLRMLGRTSELQPTQEQQRWSKLLGRPPLETFEEVFFIDIDLGKTTYDEKLAVEYVRIFQKVMVEFGAQPKHTRCIVFASNEGGKLGLHGYFYQSRIFDEERYFYVAQARPVFERRWREPPGGVPWDKAIDCPNSLRLPLIDKITICPACVSKSIDNPQRQHKKSMEKEKRRQSLSHIEGIQNDSFQFQFMSNLPPPPPPSSSSTSVSSVPGETNSRRVVHSQDGSEHKTGSSKLPPHHDAVRKSIRDDAALRDGVSGNMALRDGVSGNMFARAIKCPTCQGEGRIFEHRRYLPVFHLTESGDVDNSPLDTFREFVPPRKVRTPMPEADLVRIQQQNQKVMTAIPHWSDKLFRLLVICTIRMPRSDEHTRFILPKKGEYVFPSFLPPAWLVYARGIGELYYTVRGRKTEQKNDHHRGPVPFIHSRLVTTLHGGQLEVNMSDMESKALEEKERYTRKRLLASKAAKDLLAKHQNFLRQCVVGNGRIEETEGTRLAMEDQAIHLAEIMRNTECKKIHMEDWSTDPDLAKIYYMRLEALQKFINHSTFPDYARLTVQFFLPMTGSGMTSIRVKGPGERCCMIAARKRFLPTPYTHKSNIIRFSLRRFNKNRGMLRLYQDCLDPDCQDGSYIFEVEDIHLRCLFDPARMLQDWSAELSSEQKHLCEWLMTKNAPYSHLLPKGANKYTPTPEQHKYWTRHDRVHEQAPTGQRAWTEEEIEEWLPKPPDYQAINDWISYVEDFKPRCRPPSFRALTDSELARLAPRQRAIVCTKSS